MGEILEYASVFLAVIGILIGQVTAPKGTFYNWPATEGRIFQRHPRYAIKNITGAGWLMTIGTILIILFSTGIEIKEAQDKKHDQLITDSLEALARANQAVQQHKLDSQFLSIQDLLAKYNMKVDSESKRIITTLRDSILSLTGEPDPFLYVGKLSITTGNLHNHRIELHFLNKGGVAYDVDLMVYYGVYDKKRNFTKVEPMRLLNKGAQMTPEGLHPIFLPPIYFPKSVDPAEIVAVISGTYKTSRLVKKPYFNVFSSKLPFSEVHFYLDGAEATVLDDYRRAGVTIIRP